jgi:hypothetical protein
VTPANDAGRGCCLRPEYLQLRNGCVFQIFHFVLDDYNNLTVCFCILFSVYPLILVPDFGNAAAQTSSPPAASPHRCSSSAVELDRGAAGCVRRRSVHELKQVWLLLEAYAFFFLSIASTMRCRPLRVLVALILILLLYNSFVVHLRVLPFSSSESLSRPNSRSGAASVSLNKPSPVQTSAPSAPNPSIVNSTQPSGADPAPTPAVPHPAAQTNAPAAAAEPACNHVRNPSFENRYAAIAMLPSTTARLDLFSDLVPQLLRRHAVSRLERGHHRHLAAIFR